MGLFRKKTDPLDQRADSLNRRIAELEAEISRLNQSLAPEQRPDTPASKRPAPPAAGPPSPAADPRPAAPEPVFEKMPARRLEPRRPEAPGEGAVELGLRRPVWSQWWRRLRGRWVEPPPANEKLVNYLAAGSIQGLRPLRYEKRVARNRMIFIMIVVGLFLWGVIVVFWHAR